VLDVAFLVVRVKIPGISDAIAKELVDMVAKTFARQVVQNWADKTFPESPGDPSREVELGQSSLNLLGSHPEADATLACGQSSASRVRGRASTDGDFISFALWANKGNLLLLDPVVPPWGELRVCVGPECPGCVNIAGTWLVTETGEGRCIVDGVAGSGGGRGSGIVEIRQDEGSCSFSYEIGAQGIVLPRKGTIEGNRITITGPATVSIPGVTFTQNMLSGKGTVSGDSFSATGEGRIAGTVSGGGVTVSITCDVTSTARGLRR
jgi:hypothetical protein